MVQYIIQGGKPLQGTVHVSGAKNAAVAILPATLLVDGVCHLDNVPDISDVRLLLDILADMGAVIRRKSPNAMEIDCTRVRNVTAPIELVRRFRASYYLIGAELGRFGSAKVALPGGCNFSDRPIDQHIKGFRAMGADVQLENGYVIANANGKLTGGHIFPDVVSVGTTINLIIAGALAEGTTVIENCAKEPHVVDLANFLNAMGAQISGAGTDTIKIKGVKSLGGGSYTIIPDQIEAGTYMAAAAATAGEVMVRNVIPKHMECITAKLREMGVEVTEFDDALLIRRNGRMQAAKVKTMPYPGFPTDMQPQLAVCMALAEGTSVITEGIYDTRFGYTGELNRMGANIQVETKIAIINGVEKLHGCCVKALDLRAGAAMVIAGLTASEETTIDNVHYIERGYENIIDKLRGLGANIKRIETPTADPAQSAG